VWASQPVTEHGLRAADFLRVPEAFVRYNKRDQVWLAKLPALLERLATQWSLTLGAHYPNIEINYVAPAQRRAVTACVLKVSRFVDETRNEIAALQLWNGEGAARLLDADPDAGALLIERLEPGGMLVEVAETNDDASTRIAADMLSRLWRPAPEVHDLRLLESWCEAYDRNRKALARGDREFPADLFQRADSLRRELLASTGTPMVLHGDMHHYNVLRSQRAEWLAIDPKGLAGDPCFDVCQFLRNPHDMPAEVNRRRLDIFCATLGLNRSRVKDWCFVHAMLDACWDYEDGNSWDHQIAYAKETLSY
jgi:streptomycin 6-kinase